ncbi:multiheme c-type cytochrome, partial [Candidatus Thiosymbion oneisti]|uniref:multiheme c-type cytochrome n=1 Tax=Candidatus Thiosymbion oneisti TaxID=589554 RepID=UPI000B7E00C6
ARRAGQARAPSAAIAAAVGAPSPAGWQPAGRVRPGRRRWLAYGGWRKPIRPRQTVATPSVSRGLAGLVFGITLSAAAGSDDYWTLPVPPQGTAPAGYVEPAKDLSPAACGVCHRKQFREWSSSLHAGSARGGVLGQLPAFDRETQISCLNCHAPRSEQQARFLAADAGQVQSLSGVDCAACHVRRHRRYGPGSKPITPHGRVEALPLFKDAAFCSPCHQFPDWGERVNGKLLEDTEQEWRASPYAAAGIGCRDCHMPAGSHAFKGIHDPGMGRRALQVEIRRRQEGIELRARNLGAGHALPTYATPRIRVILRSGGPEGAGLEHIIQRQLQWDPDMGWTEVADTRLGPGQELRLALALEPAADAEAVLFVEPDALYAEQVYPSLEASIGADLDPISLRLLREARHRAGQTGFVLYRARCPPWPGREVVCAIEFDIQLE